MFNLVLVFWGGLGLFVLFCFFFLVLFQKSKQSMIESKFEDSGKDYIGIIPCVLGHLAACFFVVLINLWDG